MREAIDNWAKARATSRREKVPNKHLVMMVMKVMKVMLMKVMKMMVMVMMVVMVVMVLTKAIQKI